MIRTNKIGTRNIKEKPFRSNVERCCVVLYCIAQLCARSTLPSCCPILTFFVSGHILPTSSEQPARSQSNCCTQTSDVPASSFQPAFQSCLARHSAQKWPYRWWSSWLFPRVSRPRAFLDLGSPSSCTVFHSKRVCCDSRRLFCAASSSPTATSTSIVAARPPYFWSFDRYRRLFWVRSWLCWCLLPSGLWSASGCRSSWTCSE